MYDGAKVIELAADRIGTLEGPSRQNPFGAALGLDHQRLVHPHEGREDSLTDSPVTGASVVHGLLA